MINIKLYRDGDQWCALVGDNIQSGLVGFGDSPIAALSRLLLELHFNSNLLVKPK